MIHLRPRPKERLNIREPERRESQRHRKFVRTGKFSNCIVKDCTNRPLQFCHVRAGLPAGYQAGVAQKPSDVFGFAACDEHHRQQHAIGERSFEIKHGVNLLATALEYGANSTDPDIKALALHLRAQRRQ